MQLELKQLQIPPGNQILLKDLNWSNFETLLSELGEHRATRLSSRGILERMVPLPDHETGKIIINLLQDGQYQRATTSRIFPDWPLTEIIPEYLAMSRRDGRNPAMRKFRNWVRQQI